MNALLRRDFLRTVVAVAGPVVVGCGDGEAGDTASPEYFPQSVASGDPRPSSVVLWTRVVDAEASGSDLLVELEVALDPEFEQRVELGGGLVLAMAAQPASDGALKVRVENLEPATTYYYRFAYSRDGERHVSRTGRTRTAPDPESDAVVRFAVVSCQDYAGHYYHVLRHAASQPLDFFVHLGDYVYETTSDPSFQSPTPERDVRFGDPDAAIPRGSGLAARSLDNYRDLYRTYRSDPDLQRLHELFPMIAVSDDHEFSNDCHGAHATYSEGRENEEDLERRANSDRAWFEFMPVDYAEAPARALDASEAFPEDFRIYRSFVFGKHLELVLTDLRRYRPDHLVPEDAFPGAVFLGEGEAEELLGELPEDAVAYLDVDADENADLREALRAAGAILEFNPERIAGLLSVPWINSVFAATGGEALDESASDYERGYAYHQLLKTAEFSSQGARYLVSERPFRALARKKLVESDGASERLMGDAQRAWFLETLRSSTRTWKVWGNEYTLMQRVIDLREVTIAPPEFQVRIVLDADDWDGAPNERDQLLAELEDVPGVVAFTGDLHAFFAGTPYAADDEAARIVEFVTGSVSSTTWLHAIERTVENDPTIPPEAALIAQLVGSLLVDDDTRPNPHIGWLDLERNGYAVAAAGPDALEVTLFTIADTDVQKPPAALSQPLDALFRAEEFRVPPGGRELERKILDTWRRWDRNSLKWV
ncbi:MAG TPA: alkaline phosphatase D family protein [Polyangiaceae bacterium]